MMGQFRETDHENYVPPLLLGYMGPPGGGKTKSALRTAEGMQRVRGGDIILGDTERGRALKYRQGPRNPNGHVFRHFPISPPFKPEHFINFIREMVALKPAAIIIDSLSDEHEGEGGYLDWHDEEVPRSGGNEWAAWKKPSASRRKLIAGIQQVDVPLIFTFRAREKTKQITEGGRKKVVPIGYVPIAPSEIVHTLDLTCLLPPRSNGVALWQSPKEGEDFVLKYPEFLAQYIRSGMVLEEDFGEALARWQLGLVGDKAPAANGATRRTPEQKTDAYVLALNGVGKLASGEDDLENGLEKLRTFQAVDQTVKWIETLKVEHPALYDRVITANSRRARELMPKVDEPTSEEEAEDLSVPANPDATDNDDKFPGDE
jgi:hypothetical protein